MKKSDNSFSSYFRFERYGTLFLIVSLLVFFSMILIFNFALNSQNLPRHDGVDYQIFYWIVSKNLYGVGFKDFFLKFLNGEYDHNSLIPFFSYLNSKSNLIFPSYLMLGTSNVLVIFFASIAISSLASLVLFDAFSISTAVLFFLLLMTQKIFWALGSGWFDLRIDLGPTLVVLMSYLSAVLILLRGRFMFWPMVTFFLGTTYLVLARPPMIAFQGLSTVLALTLIAWRSPQRRKKKIGLGFVFLLVISPVLLTLIPRMKSLKEYYFVMGYEGNQWPHFKTFWLHDVARVYGSLSVCFWMLTLIVIIFYLFRPVVVKHFLFLESDVVFRLNVFLIPAVITFLVLNYEGVYGNPFGYILFMISGCAGLLLLAQRLLLKYALIGVSVVIVVFSFLSAVKEIKAQVNSDKILIDEFQKCVVRMDQLAGAEPYGVVFLTAAGADCPAIDVLNLDHRIPKRLLSCRVRVHPGDFEMEKKINGRGDTEQLRARLPAIDWQKPTFYSPEVILEKNQSPTVKPKKIFFWSLMEGDPEFKNDNAYLYSHRVADVLDAHLLRKGAKKVFTSPPLRADVFELNQ